MTQNRSYNSNIQEDIPASNSQGQVGGQFIPQNNNPPSPQNVQQNTQQVQNNWQVPSQQNSQYPSSVPVNNTQQSVPISPSPEVPARIESQESMPMPERMVESEKAKERSEKTNIEEEPKEKITKEPEHEPEEKRFESPFRVYGYQAPSNMTQLGDSLKTAKVKGNPQDAKTWLFVLLGKLLRICKGEAFKT